ncbi:chemotaxis protein CheA [Paramaledivibacter caminithermalis]|jgi:two-component system chemotaxis sensor kinase CheA|uniref:Chemotaxis protein CheA n=1 Tax=Paramaledivibacter caminithermalis (strain DSM 15212 / CIP 107654 / DViRD3) TaxID=1121301 RepID=A0A1M6P8Q8_PARC5|nr:chemotaxis protein CheA [Paramaledivibacter caminithermalis]SHK04303.1 two-component system, chemotaxis family, sensor kinase CheA [Paramaledivibacter caminithermalis DSM 15212]
MDKFNIDEVYYSMFLEETQEQIEKIEQDLLLLENGQGDKETINDIFRMAHSIKGASATMGFEDMERLSHSLENLLSKIRDMKININVDIINTFFKGIDKLKYIHSCLSKGEDYVLDINELIEEINSLTENSTKTIKNEIELNGNGMEDEENNCKDIENLDIELSDYENELCEDIDLRFNIYKIVIIMNEDTVMKSVKAFLIVNNLLGIGDVISTDPLNFEKICDEDFKNPFKIVIATEKSYEEIYKNINSISEIKRIFIKKVRKSKKQGSTPKNVKIISSKDNFKRKDISTIRIDVNKIDKLLNLVGEFIIHKENLIQIGDELKRKYKTDPLVKKLVSILPNINYIGTELQETVMSARMLPLDSVFNRFPRMVRNLAQKSNKDIDFIIEGKETEIDRGIIEELVDPLTHIIRNAVDHGIETKEERRRKNKEERARIILSARHEENNVVIEIEDNGKGISIEDIKKKIIEKNLAEEEELQALSEKEIIQYIFEPGFSTAKEITDISGRGVGLDVVKENIGKLSGIVEVKSQKEKGTKFIIKLPLTLAIIQALLIKEGNYIFAIPISSIIETIRVKENEIKEKIHRIGDLEVFDWRNQAITVISIAKYFEIEEEMENKKLFVIVVGHSEKRFAFIVNRLLGEQEIVIKSMGAFIGKDKLLGNIKGISGVSILGDGTFAHIVDIASIIRG